MLLQLPELIYLLLWSFSLSLLAVFFFLALIIFYKTKRKLFGYYGLYCVLVCLYLSSKLSGTPVYYLFEQHRFQDFNWLIQIGFYSIYYLFGLHFLKLNETFPRFFSVIKKYVLLVLTIAAGIGLYGVFFQQHVLRYFYAFVFIPLHIIAAVTIMFFALKEKNKYTLYFISGSSIYILFALFAFLGPSFDFLNPFGINSLAWFFLAVIIESSIFSYAMGLMIWNIYKRREQTSIELNQALQVIEKQMIDEKIMRENEKELLQTQVAKEQLSSKVAFLQNKILLEQINAHFIFNVLNAIKVFVAENQSERAILFLNKFARFIRNVLDGSRSNLITLAEEIKNMDTYLSIEKMRFDHKFQYQFDIAENMNMEKVNIPTFLVQPFIENALWHGIMPSSGSGFLWIKIYAVETTTFIEIDDNGIGVNQSKKSKKTGQHRSVGIDLVNEIINNYNANQPGKIIFNIEDKMTINGTEGTQVTIALLGEKIADRTGA